MPEAMIDEPLIQAIKQGDAGAVQTLLDAGTNVNIHGSEQDWTPLNYAAGRGDLTIVKLLVEVGNADLTLTGRDNRPPYEIAVSAGHRAVARYLADAGDRVGKRGFSVRRPYCRAYHLRALREFPCWADNSVRSEEQALPDDAVVFVHQDFTVTRSMFHAEDVILNDVSPQWEAFCRTVLRFKVPDDFDLMPASRSDVGPQSGV